MILYRWKVRLIRTDIDFAKETGEVRYELPLSVFIWTPPFRY